MAYERVHDREFCFHSAFFALNSLIKPVTFSCADNVINGERAQMCFRKMLLRRYDVTCKWQGEEDAKTANNLLESSITTIK